MRLSFISTINNSRRGNPIKIHPFSLFDLCVVDGQLKQLKGGIGGIYYHIDASMTSYTSSGFGTYGKDSDKREFVRLTGQNCIVIPASIIANKADFSIQLEMMFESSNFSSGYLVSQKRNYSYSNELFYGYVQSNRLVINGVSWEDNSVPLGIRTLIVFRRYNKRTSISLQTINGSVTSPNALWETTITTSPAAYLYIGLGLKAKLYSVQIGVDYNSIYNYYR